MKKKSVITIFAVITVVCAIAFTAVIGGALSSLNNKSYRELAESFELGNKKEKVEHMLSISKNSSVKGLEKTLSFEEAYNQIPKFTKNEELVNNAPSRSFGSLIIKNPNDFLKSKSGIIYTVYKIEGGGYLYLFFEAVPISSEKNADTDYIASEAFWVYGMPSYADFSSVVIGKTSAHEINKLTGKDKYLAALDNSDVMGASSLDKLLEKFGASITNEAIESFKAKAKEPYSERFLLKDGVLTVSFVFDEDKSTHVVSSLEFENGAVINNDDIPDFMVM